MSPDSYEGAVRWADGAPGRAGHDDLRFLEPPALDRLMGVVMELAAEVNVERYHRIALVEALVRRGLIEAETLDALEGDERFLEAARAELLRDVARLFSPIEEHGPPWQPLRDPHLPASDSTSQR